MLPVKWMPASSGCGTATSDTAPPLPVTMLTTPGGSPAASSSRMMKCADSCWVGEGFQTTVLPMSAGASGRLPAIAVKLNGVIARTKPSSGRWSVRFQTPGARDRLLLEDLPAERDVEAQEVDELAGAVDLGLERRLALAEHRRGVERVAPRPGEQVGRAQQHRRPVVERRVAPGRGGGQRGVDGRLHVGRAGVAGRAEHGRVAVRLHDVDRLAAAGALLPGDRHRQVVRRRAELLEPRLERGRSALPGA